MFRFRLNYTVFQNLKNETVDLSKDFRILKYRIVGHNENSDRDVILTLKYLQKKYLIRKINRKNR